MKKISVFYLEHKKLKFLLFFIFKYRNDVQSVLHGVNGQQKNVQLIPNIASTAQYQSINTFYITWIAKHKITVGKYKAVVLFFHSADKKDFVFLLQPAITATKRSFDKSARRTRALKLHCVPVTRKSYLWSLRTFREKFER